MVSVLCIILGVLNSGPHAEGNSASPVTITQTVQRDPYQIDPEAGTTVKIPGGPPPTVSFPNGRRPFQIPSGNDAGVVKGGRPSIPTGATMDPLPRRPGTATKKKDETSNAVIQNIK